MRPNTREDDLQYITYELDESSEQGGAAARPAAERVYVPGRVTDWRAGEHEQEGRRIHGLRVEYEPHGAAKRGTGGPTLTKVFELPEHAHGIAFRHGPLPTRYAFALPEGEKLRND